MFLASIVIQGLIIVGLVILFLLVTILNRKTKTPDNVELPEQCRTCASSTCMISLKKVEEMKKKSLNKFVKNAKLRIKNEKKSRLY